MEPDAPVTAGMLREFVLSIALKLEQLRTDMHRSVDAFRLEMQEEFRRLHSRIDRLEDRLLLHDRTLTTTTRLAGLTAGVALAVSLFALLR